MRSKTATYALVAFGMTTVAVSPASAQILIAEKPPISTSCNNCDMSDRRMPRVHFNGANFSGTDFRRANLNEVVMDNSDFEMAKFNKAYLMQSKSRNAKFSGAVFRDATLSNAAFIKADMREADFSSADLNGARFEGSDLSGSNFTGAEAQNTDFSGATMNYTSLHHSDLTGANFSGSILGNTDFGDALLTETTFTGANLSGANLAFTQGLTQDQISEACGSLTTQLPQNLRIRMCEDQAVLTPRGKINHIRGGRAKLVINGLDIGAILRQSAENLATSQREHQATLYDLEQIMEMSRPGTKVYNRAKAAHERTSAVLKTLTQPRP